MPVLWAMHGLTIRCDDAVLDARRAPSGARPDLTVRMLGRGPVPTMDESPPGDVLARVEDDATVWLSVLAHPSDDPDGANGVVDIHVHGLATAFFDPRRRTVELVLGEHVDQAFAPILIGGTIISVVLALIGHPVLHASAVAVEVSGQAKVVAFVGRSGMGKSTLATLACRDGASLFTDDVLRTDLVDDAVLAWPGATAARLRTPATALATQAAAAVSTTADGRTSASLRLAPDRPVALGAIVIPQPDRSSDVIRIERLSGIDAVLMLAAFPRILGWRHPATTAQAHRHWGDLARRVPVMVAHVPWGPPFTPDLGRALLDEILATAGPERAPGDGPSLA